MNSKEFAIKISNQSKWISERERMLRKPDAPKMAPRPMNYGSGVGGGASYSLGSCTETKCCAVPTPGPTVACNQEKDATMYLNNNPLDIQQKAYLADRLAKVAREIDSKMLHDFGLVDDDRPNTIGELIERITKGRYVIEDKAKAEYSGDALYTITWRDPAIKADQAGYDAAKEAMQNAKTAVTDTIIVKDAEAGLAAVTEFASKTFH